MYTSAIFAFHTIAQVKQKYKLYFFILDFCDVTLIYTRDLGAIVEYSSHSLTLIYKDGLTPGFK